MHLLSEDAYVGNPFEELKMVKYALGKVESVRVTRSGLILIRCICEEQRKFAVGFKTTRTTEVSCFELGSRTPVRGVIWGVKTGVQVEYTKRIPGVVGSRRLTRWVNGRNRSLSVLLFYEEEHLPTHVKLGYVRYTGRAFIPEPLQRKSCKGSGHGSSVCRLTEYNEERCVEGRQCGNCGGDHDPEFPECPVRGKERKVSKVRAAKRISRAEAN